MEKKAEIIEKLYFLRAMLSKLSQNQDAIEALEEEREAFVHSEYQPLKLEKDLMCELKKQEDELISLKTSLDQLHSKEYKIDEKLKWIKVPKIDSPTASWGPAVFFLAITACATFFAFRWWMNTNYSFWTGVLFFTVSIVSLIWDIAVAMVCSSKKYAEKENQKNLKEYQNTMDSLSIEKERIAKEKRALEIKKVNCENRIEKFKIVISNNDVQNRIGREKFYKTRQAKLDEIENMTLAMIKKSELINEVADNISIVDKRDWKNLDIVIYEIETGRAESIKEALQQADLYIRHGEIIEAMENASEAICSTIKESIGDLSRSIGRSLSNLCSEMSSLRVEINEMNQVNRELREEVSDKFDDLLNAQELSNALQKKATVSSERLAEDVRRMRLLRDEEYYRH